MKVFSSVVCVGVHTSSIHCVRAELCTTRWIGDGTLRCGVYVSAATHSPRQVCAALTLLVGSSEP